jgi:hypothetical protein
VAAQCVPHPGHAFTTRAANGAAFFRADVQPGLRTFQPLGQGDPHLFRVIFERHAESFDARHARLAQHGDVHLRNLKQLELEQVPRAVVAELGAARLDAVADAQTYRFAAR